MKKHLLIVDDDASVRESLRKLLQDSGYDVAAAVDGEDAESQLRNGTFDLLILDVDLPRRDGWDVLEFLSEANPLLPVVMITGLMDQMATTVIPGVSALLSKPVEVPVLLQKIERLLNQAPEERLSAINQAVGPIETNAGQFYELKARRSVPFAAR